MTIAQKTSLILVIFGVIIIVHQIMVYGIVWDWSQVLHHENIALFYVFTALGILIGEAMVSEWRKM